VRLFAQLALISLLISCSKHPAPQVDAGVPLVPPVVRVLPKPEPPDKPGPPHKPVPPHPRVARCLAEEGAHTWKELEGCLKAAWPEIKADADAGHKLGGPSPFPPNANPSWGIPAVHLDPASRLATCSDDNTCVDSAHPCCTWQQWESRWGTRDAQIKQATTVSQHSSDAVNPPTDTKIIRPRVQNGAQFGWQNDFVQVCSGTFSSVTQLSRSYPDTAISATLCGGLSQPTLVTDTSHGPCDMWIDNNTSGNTWVLSHYLGNGATMIPPSGGSDGGCSISNGDSYTASVPIISNIRYWDPVWEDLVDLPDSRPTLYGGLLGVGVNTGAGSDTAQVYIGLNGSALNEVAFSSSTHIAQTRLTHGSRAWGYMQNVFFADTSFRTTISTDGPMVPDVGSSGAPVKLIEINGGRLAVPILHNVTLTGDVRVSGGGAFGSGSIVYGNVYMPTAFFRHADVSPNQSTGGIWYGAGGGIDISAKSVVRYTAPAATNFTTGGISLDGTFDGYAVDDSATPLRTWVHVPSLQSTTINALDNSIGAGGCGGHCVGRAGSEVSAYVNVNASPPPLFISDGGVQLFGCNTPGAQCDIVGAGAGATVSGGTGINVTGGPAYTVALSTPVSVANGGTSDSTLTSHAALLGAGSSAVAFATPSTSGQCLCSNGASSDPTFQTVAYGNLSGTPATVSVAAGTGISVTGGPNPYTVALSTPVSVSNGGTGDSTLAAHMVLLGESTSAVSTVAAGTGGQVLTYNSSIADPTWQSLPAIAGPSNYAVITSHDIGGSTSINDLASISLNAPSSGVFLLDLNIGFRVTPASGGTNALPSYGYGTSGSAFVSSRVADCFGSVTLSPAAEPTCDYTMMLRLSVSAGSVTYHALAQSDNNYGSGVLTVTYGDIRALFVAN
jgi:hypothetical protein